MGRVREASDHSLWKSVGWEAGVGFETIFVCCALALPEILVLRTFP